MQHKTIESDILRVLDEVKEKGYIPAKDNQISIYYQKTNHLLNAFLQESAVNPEAAVTFMEKLAEICRKAPAFLPFFPETMMALYDKAIKGDTFTQNRAKTKLLLFFSNISPQSVEQKVSLLKKIQAMSDWLRRKKEVSKVVGRVANHYDFNQQFLEDSDLSFLVCLSDVLNQICTSITTKRHKISEKGVQAPERDLFNSCAALIKTRAPELYNNLWTKSFIKTPSKKNYTFKIQDATVVPVIQKKRYSGVLACHDWERT